MSAKWISLSTFLVGTSGYDNVWSLDKNMAIGKFDLTFNCIDTLFIGVADTNEHEAGFCIDFKTMDKVYLGGTKNSSLFFSPFASYFYLIRMDTSFNVSFIKSIGYQNEYLGLYKVLATNDGGVLLAGTKYNAATANGQERDIYVIKLDSLGNYVTGTGNSPIAQVYDFIIYPNPAASQLTLQYSPLKTTGHATVYNVLGEAVQQLTLLPNTIRQQLSIAHLPSGIYLLKVEADGKSGVKRFVRE